jgi:hypothetical protein
MSHYWNIIKQLFELDKKTKLGVDWYRQEIYHNKYKGQKYYDDAFNLHPKQSKGFLGQLFHFKKTTTMGAAFNYDYCSCTSCKTLTNEAEQKIEELKAQKRLLTFQLLPITIPLAFSVFLFGYLLKR